MTQLAKNDAIVLSATDAVRQMFWGKVDKTGDCWLWQGLTTSFGHGRYHIKRKLVSAHRIAKLWEEGVTKLDKLACHSCANRLCVKPSHIYWGSHADNMSDMVRTGGSQHGKTRGEKHARALVSDEVAATIWQELLHDPQNLVGIAKALGVSRNTVASIKYKCSYKSVTDKMPSLPATPKAENYTPIVRRHKQSFTPKQAIQLCDMIDDGVGIENVSRFANTCPATLHNIYFKKYGRRPKLRGASPRTKTKLPATRLC